MEMNENLERLTNIVADFTSLVGKRLPDDVTAKLKELAETETTPMAQMIYKTMAANQEKAWELNRPSCQDTGLIQMFVSVGSKFPYVDELADVLKEQSYEALMKIGWELVAAFFLGGALLSVIMTPLTYWFVKNLVIRYRRRKAVRLAARSAK